MAAIFVVFSLLGGARGVAFAQSDDTEVRARELFGVGKYAEALALYGKLYAATAHPTYLRNIGRCYQNLGEPDKAISSFHEYLRQATNVTPEQRSQVEGYIREMEALKAKRDAAPAPVAPQAAPPPLSAQTSSPPVQVQASQPEGAAPPDAARSSGHAAAYGVGAGGLALVAVGAVFGVRALSLHGQSNDECPTSTTCSMKGVDLNNDARTSAHLCDGFVGAGIVAVGVATYLYFHKASDEGGTRVARVSDLDLRPVTAGALLTLRSQW
jgi:hypothetical protein